MSLSNCSSNSVFRSLRLAYQISSRYALGLALALGGLGISDAAWAQWTDTVYCANIPEEIVFRRYRDESANKTLNQRLERYPGSSVFVAKHKNTAQRADHGPAFIRNCAIPQAATQWISFKFRTTDFFGTGIGSHLAVLLRGKFIAPLTLNVDRVSDRSLDYMKYNGRGLSIFPLLPEQHNISGATVEVFNTDSNTGIYEVVDSYAGRPFIPRDGAWFSVQIHVNLTHISYWISDAGGSLVSTATVAQAGVHNADVNGGWGIGVLCNNLQSYASCEMDGSLANQTFDVRFIDVATGWF